MREKYLMEMKGITKEFPGVKALDSVDFNLKKGEVHALIGENGAGKSTLIKVLAGIHKPEAGEIILEGEKVENNSPSLAQKLGIATIHQERNLIPALSAAENVLLDHYPKGLLRFIKWGSVKRKAETILQEKLGVIFDLDTPVKKLSVANQQLVEIAKALSLDPKMMILDEPTASLTDSEVERLFEVIRNLKSQNVGMIYISHRLEELPLIADRITVMRDGKSVAHHETNNVDNDIIVSEMVGRKIENRFPPRDNEIGNPLLTISNFTKKGVFEDINLYVREGEVAGIAGLIGAGRTELARCIFGVDKYDSGQINVKGQKKTINNIQDALKNGIALVVEDRKEQGLVLSLSVKHNITLASHSIISKLGWIITDTEDEITEKYISELDIRTPHAEQKVLNLSGGNQQKVVIAKWLASQFDILILDEPTIGIDVGARAEIYQLINEITANGCGVILISSDLTEIIGMSDRIYVMREGKIAGEVSKEEAYQEKIMSLATT